MEEDVISTWCERWKKPTTGYFKIGHIVKLGKCTEDCFVLPTVLTAKRGGAVKLGFTFQVNYQADISQLVPDAELERTC